MSKLYDEMKKLQAEKGEQSPEPAVVVDQNEGLLPPGIGKKKSSKPIPISASISVAGPKPQPAASMDFAPKRKPLSYLIVGLAAGIALTWAASYMMGPAPVLTEKESATSIPTESVTVKSFTEIPPQKEAAIIQASVSTPPADDTTKLLTNEDLQGKSAWELKIMRNEIYARHSYIFTTTRMQEHFAKEPWYTPKHKNVSAMLTETDIANIKLIRSFERKL